jgi:hypothetical protein
MHNRIDRQLRKSESEPHPTPTELALKVGFTMLFALCVALLAQWAAPSQG